MKKILVAVLGVAAMQAAALATIFDVNVQGTATGGFDAQALSSTNLLSPGLTYFGSTFNATTAGGTSSIPGFVGLGGNPVPSPLNFNNLGSFVLDSTVASYNGHTFTLQVLFSAPPGIGGGNPQTFTADIFGVVSTLTGGGVLIDFNNTPQTFSFSNASQTGTISLSVNDVSISPGHIASVTGTLRSTVIPEVSSMLPLALVLGLVCGAEMIRRRRNAQLTDAA
jgi:hypothetical protein